MGKIKSHFAKYLAPGRIFSTWHAAVPGVTKVRHDLGTEQQKQSIFGGQRESENSGNSFLSPKTRFQENLCLVSATSVF